MPIDDQGRRGSVRAQQVAQGRKPGVAGCVRCSLATIVAAALLVAAPASAQERSIWALVINDEPKGDVEILLTADGPWIDPAVLVAAGVLKVPAGRRQVFAPDTIMRVSLASLAPQITFTLDEAEIRLLISADPALLSATELAISNPRPPGWKVSSNNAVFLNYSANWSTNDKTAGYGEFGAHLFGALFQTAASVDDTGAVTRGLTGLTVDQVRSRRRWVFGDTIGRSTTLGSSPVVGGFSLSTQQDLDPYYAIYPSPQIRGAVRTPSTADVYVDGRLVSSVRLPPGQFTLNDLPLETGLGNAQVIIRDAFGREQSINLGFYLSTRLLKRRRAGLFVCRGAGTNVERHQGRVRARDGHGGPQHRPHRLVHDRLPGRRRKRPRDGRRRVQRQALAAGNVWRRSTGQPCRAIVQQLEASSGDPGYRAMPRPASTPSSRPGSAPTCARRGSGRSSRTFS